MSSASSERYQSRLFNFVHQQSRRWGDELGRTFRSLKVAANWSLEALIYPIFQLIQKAVESSGKQLHGGQEQHRLQLQANDTDFQSETTLVADTPILRVLQAVNIWQAEEEDKRTRGQSDAVTHESITPFSLTPPPRAPHLSISPSLSTSNVRGIASELSNHQLVLVTCENEILDILTPQQQQRLEERIIAEVANYWHDWRLIQAKKTTSVFSEINDLLTKLTSDHTVEQAPSLSADKKESSIEYPSLLKPEETLLILDTTVAKLESNALEPVSRASWNLIQVLQNQFQIFIYGQEQITTTKQTTVAADNLKNQTPQKIQALIGAALNFFFGERKGKKLEPNTSANRVSKALPINPRIKPGKRLPQSSQSQNGYLGDPWLNESDLFGGFEEASEPVNQNLNNQKSLEFSSDANYSLPPTDKAKYSLQNIMNRVKAIALVRISKSSTQLAQRQKSVHDLTATQKTPAKIATTTQQVTAISQVEKEVKSVGISQQLRQSNATSCNGSNLRKRVASYVEAKPDWIEIKARIIGYEKHPLEQILEWLDRVILWVETLFVIVFYFLKGFLGIKN